MSLIIPNYISDYSVDPLVTAYGWIDLLVLEYGSLTGSLRVTVHESEAAYNAGKSPLTKITKILGDSGGLPPLSSLLASNQAAFVSINNWFYQQVASLAQFPGAVVNGDSVTIPNYDSPFSTTPVPDAYGWIDEVILDNAAYAGWVSVRIYTSESDYQAGKQPIDRLRFVLGDPGSLPSLPVFMYYNQKAFSEVRYSLYSGLSDIDPFVGSTVSQNTWFTSLELDAMSNLAIDAA